MTHRHGQGRVFRRGSRWWIAYYHEGREIREPSRSDDERVAARLLKDRLGAIYAGTFIAPRQTRVTVGDLLETLRVEMEARGLKGWYAIKGIFPRLSAALGQHRAASVTPEMKLQRAEERCLDLKRHFLSIDPSHHMLKIDLEQDLDKELRDLEALRRTLSATPVAATITSADVTELLALAEKVEAIWDAPTTTNEDRKHILSTVISKVILHDSNDEKYDVEIVWASGFSERKQFLKVHGATNLVADMRQRGRPVSEILETVTALGVTTQRGRPFNRKALQHKLWMLGFNKKGPRIEALRVIRSMLIDRRSRQEILEALRTQGPQPYEGEWTTERITTAIKSIQSGAWAPEIPPLPADVPRLRRLPPEAIRLFIHARRMGWTFQQIADELNALRFRTPRGSAFTKANAYQLYEHLKQDPSLADALPEEPPPPALRADGQPRKKSGAAARQGAQEPDAAIGRDRGWTAVKSKRQQRVRAAGFPPSAAVERLTFRCRSPSLSSAWQVMKSRGLRPSKEGAELGLAANENNKEARNETGQSKT